ncbi:DUF1330 domain-containing protein [Marinomonas epiphytica]
MAYYSVLEVTPISQDWLANYVAKAGDLVTKYGGQYLANTSNHERLEGKITDQEEPAVRVILVWPNRSAAIDFMNAPEYQPLLKARTAGSHSQHVLIEGLN